MNFLYKLFRQDPNSREGVIMATSWLGILVNLLCAGVKIIIGLAVSSIAVVSEGLNNAADVSSSVLTIIGTKLAGKHPTKKHPFGYGRIEYFTSMIIAGMIMITGYETAKESVMSIFEPGEMSITPLVIVIVAVSALIKFLLGSYMIKQGNRINASSLVGVGKDCKMDCIVSVVTILATLVYLVFHLSIDAYAGVITSLFILKAGYEILKETMDSLLGTAGDKDLADDLYKIIRSNPIVLNAADMILHNYGPDAYSGSVNIEVDHKLTVDEIYANIHAMQLQIMHEHHITMVFGLYAVNGDSEVLKEMRRHIASFVKSHDHVISYHALYIDSTNNDIYCDLVVDYDLQDWDALREEFTAYMKAAYPEQRLELVIETEFV
ncbi:MAG: cation diffusion facilitator family transporter [Acetatifactor sp.]|nr:cation diffusion facilitator family transporter [Acetatifactor sp.]